MMRNLESQNNTNVSSMLIKKDGKMLPFKLEAFLSKIPIFSKLVSMNAELVVVTQRTGISSL